MPTSAQKKYCRLSKDWFKPASKNGGVNEYYFENETYGFSILAVWNATDKHMRQCLRFHKWKGSIKNVRTLHKGGAKCIMPRGKSNTYFLVFSQNNLPCIVHEAYHVVSNELNRRDIGNGTIAGDEANAYLIEWVVCKLAKRMQPPLK